MVFNFVNQEAKSVIDLVNNVSNDITSNIKNYTNQDCRTESRIFLEVGSENEFCRGEIVGDVFISQFSSIGCELNDKFNADSQLSISNELSNRISQIVDQSLNQKNSFLSTGLNLGNIKAKNSIGLSNIITNNISSTFDNVCRQTSSSFQDQIIKICGKIGGNLIVKQESDIIASQSCFSEYRNTLDTNNKIVNDVDQKIKQVAKQVNEGIDSLFKWIAIIVGGIILLTIIGVIIFFVFSSKSSKDISSNVLKNVQSKGLSSSIFKNVGSAVLSEL